MITTVHKTVYRLINVHSGQQQQILAVFWPEITEECVRVLVPVVVGE